MQWKLTTNKWCAIIIIFTLNAEIQRLKYATTLKELMMPVIAILTNHPKYRSLNIHASNYDLCIRTHLKLFCNRLNMHQDIRTIVIMKKE